MILTEAITIHTIATSVKRATCDIIDNTTSKLYLTYVKTHLRTRIVRMHTCSDTSLTSCRLGGRLRDFKCRVFYVRRRLAPSIKWVSNFFNSKLTYVFAAQHKERPLTSLWQSNDDWLICSVRWFSGLDRSRGLVEPAIYRAIWNDNDTTLVYNWHWSLWLFHNYT